MTIRTKFAGVATIVAALAAPASARAQNAPSAAAPQADSAPPAAAASPSALPIARQSMLRANAPIASGGRRYEDFTIDLEIGGRVVVAAESEAFDTMIEVYRGRAGPPIAQDDDGGEGFNSRLTFTAPATGPYTIRVLSYGSTDQGSFSLSVLPASSLPGVIDVPTREIAMTWREFDGNVAASPRSRRAFADHLVRLNADEVVILRADSAAFDTVLEVFTADNRDGDPLASDDDDGFGNNSLLLFRAERAGDYVIRVRSFDSRVGSYRLGMGRHDTVAASAR